MLCCRFCTPIRICLLGFSLFFVCVLTSLSCTSNVSATDFPAVSDALDDGDFSAVISSCDNYWANNHSFYDCDMDTIVHFTKTVMPENDDGSIDIIWTWDIPSLLVGNDKYIKIKRLTYEVPSDFITSGDNFFFSVSSSYNVFFGSGRGFFYQDFYNRYKYLMGGLNSYLFYNRWNEMYSCPDQNSDVCQFQFDFNSTTGVGSAFYLSSHFTLPSGWSGFSGIDILHNSFDQQNDSYSWTPFYDDSVLYLLNTWSDPSYSNGAPYLIFHTTFYKTDSFFDLNSSTGGTDVNDAITAEGAYIEEKLSNASNSMSGLHLDFNLINPIAPIIAAFTDISCYDFYYLPSMFGASTTRICTPWGSIRPFITPVAILMFNLILYRFIITWFKKGDQI